jgi:hypothetical protein
MKRRTLLSFIPSALIGMLSFKVKAEDAHVEFGEMNVALDAVSAIPDSVMLGDLILCAVDGVVYKTIESTVRGEITFYNKKGQIHRDGDLPAIMRRDGYCSWFKNGVCHRDNGPAVIHSDGRKEWLKNGICHREDGPAIVDPCGVREWYFNGNRHREDGPAIEDDKFPAFTQWFYKGHRFFVCDLESFRELIAPCKARGFV